MTMDKIVFIDTFKTIKNWCYALGQASGLIGLELEDGLIGEVISNYADLVMETVTNGLEIPREAQDEFWALIYTDAINVTDGHIGRLYDMLQDCKGSE